MNVLITGGAGFVGTFTKKELEKQGHQPILVDNFYTGSRDNVEEGDVLIEGDILDPEVQKVLEAKKIDAIIHLSAQIIVPTSFADPIFDMKQNIEGTIKICELAAKLNVKKVVFASSAAVYGDNIRVPLRETEPYMPMSPYGISKASAEMYIETLCRTNGIGYAILRYANIYGPKQTKEGEGGVIKIFLDKLAKDEQVTIDGDGNQTRDFIYITDVAKANVAALHAADGIYNISSNEEVTINRLFDVIVTEMGKKMSPNYGMPRKGDIYRSCLDHHKFVEKTGWKPEVSLEQGIRTTIQALNENR
ncbi:NAD-dependent epimerase/dehydratase family protein [Fictibacillus gelatini]|uniref:NAD-dependent epimerase/dehydratase family protein n=1 Tax=Fictibacillus gelatini TaxID=225985 RepID=UPI0003FC242A|nr:NAD-dependent epimerase/dehydratase family protein [Fictibacillus gelatini]